jgi:lipoprotein-releasing system ATP-binding protein
VKTALLEIRELVKTYPAVPAPLRVLKGINFSLDAGQSAAIIGPSGCGKSTLLNLIGALDQPDAGSVHISGQDLSTLNVKELAQLRNQELGFVFQQHHLLPQCTVMENILIPVLTQDREAQEQAHDRARALLDKLGLLPRAHHRPGELSGGECQRTAVARAVINNPALLLADEPTGALNEEAAEELAALLLSLRDEQNMAVIIVTHAQSIARRFGSIYTLNRGQLTREE